MSNPMSPAASPNQMQRGGVRRVNNLPIYLIGVAVAIFLCIMALVAMDRAGTKQADADTIRKNGNTTLFAKELAGDRKDGIIAASYSPAPEDFDFRPIIRTCRRCPQSCRHRSTRRTWSVSAN